MPRRPTIIDVAREAGVSKSTVSLVLQDSPLVRGTTRETVRRAMATIGYVYNRTAANLRSANVGLIGLVINDLRNPFFTEFATSVQMALSERGYATVIANTDEDPGLQAQVVGSMIEHGISALVISPAYGAVEGIFGALERASIPTLQVLRRVDPRARLFPFFGLDYAHGSRLATQHLLEVGARRIAFVGGLDGRPITAERMSGYLERMRDAGIPEICMTGRSSRAFGRDVVSRLLSEHPDCDGAVCFNDLVALGMMSGLAERGILPGKAFRLIGFDDIEECDLVWPKLSSVRCDIAAFGRDSASTMLAWLEDGRRPEPERRLAVTLAARVTPM